MANQIQIKRSTLSANAANTLLAGELAFSYNTNSLFIGAQTGITGNNIRIGGEKFNFLDRVTPGTLTANAALITDANSFVSNVYTTGLVIQSSTGAITAQPITSISNTANGSVLGTNTSGGGIATELATTAAIVQYVSGRTGAAVGANGQFLFNNSGVVTGSANFYYDYLSGAVTIGNSTVNVQTGYVTGGGQQLQHWHGTGNTYVQVQITNHDPGPSASADYVVNADNATDSTNYLDLGINGSGWSNTLWTINGADDGYLYAANGTLAIGTASAKAVQFFANGTLSTNEAMRITSGANVGIGNTNPNAKLQVTGTANISGATTLGSTLSVSGNVVIGTSAGVSANGSYGTTGQVLVSNGSGIYWGTGTTGSNTEVQFNDSGVANATAGFTFTKTTNTLSVGNTITLGNSTIFSSVNGSVITVGNSTVNSSITTSQIRVGNTTLSSTGDSLTTNSVIISANATVNNIVGTTTNISSNLAITAANIVATSSYLSVRDVAVSGNLTVSGTLTTIDTLNLQVKDSMIKLADQNTGTDTIAIGLYGVSGNATSTYYSGLYRDQAAGSLTSPVFKLFSTNTEPTTTIDNTAIGYALATLNAWLTTGAFVANSTAVNITANSTVSSALVANSLTLSTALAATSGGTGYASYATGDVLYASSTTALSKLSVPGSAANGQVLQIVNNLPAYGTLDGGTF